jgi:xylulokinase
VWSPYPRGERVPYHDPGLRASLHDLDITHDAGAIERAAFEATGFVIRSILDRLGVNSRRIVASGGGTRSIPWMQAIADTTSLPIDLVAVPEGAALGAAYLARVATGLEEGLADARRWAGTRFTVMPDPSWQEATETRFRRFVDLGPAG